MHFTEVVDVVILNGDQKALLLKAIAAAIRTKVLNHHLAQVILHASVSGTLLSVAAIMALNLVDDAVVAKLASDVFGAGLGIGRLLNGNPFPFCPVQEQILNLVGQVFIRRVEIEIVFLDRL